MKAHAFSARARIDRALVKSAERVIAARRRLDRETADHERLLAAQSAYADLDAPTTNEGAAS